MLAPLREVRAFSTKCKPVVLPELFCNWQRIDFMLQPPVSFISCRVVFGVMYGAKRHSEFIAHLECQSSRLRIPDMVRLRRRAAANDTRLLSDKAQMLF